MAFRVKGYGWYGWQIERPSFANGGQYVVTAPERPGEVHRFDHADQAERWAERHDLLAEALGQAEPMNLAPRAR